MAEEAKRTVGYLCPECHQSVIAEKTVFSLVAGASRVPCPCGKSALTTQVIDDRIQLTVPCLFCKKEHTVMSPIAPILEEKTLAFSCSTSGLDCCYVGEEDGVFAAMARLEEAVNKLEVAENAEGTFLDDMIMHECLSELKDIAQRDRGVTCTCGSHEWALKVHFSSIDLTCSHCGGGLRIPAATADDLEDLCCKYRLLIQSREG